MLTNLQLIKNYGMDIEECGEGSPFELINTLAIRDTLEEQYNLLSVEEQSLLYEYDRRLVERAHEFYNELSKVYSFQNQKPITHWWAHLDKVVNGDLVIDLINRKTHLRTNTNEDHAATLTA
ncbi:hypothetical protein [Sporomusa sp. KB1]|jgi:hypothetical protein|uniref:hypothetical protein n=1 Tax=Sporomusa sp. KB1 TaxID=943346 RepID=UPI0011A4360B|nr:hypothetical protein [Sporomusa sp. KB1]TWH48546.1 hypothetical protein Salpa_4711 [Sporomusa sp. KB1]